MVRLDSRVIVSTGGMQYEQNDDAMMLCPRSARRQLSCVHAGRSQFS